MDHIVLAAAEGETHSPVLPVWSEVILSLIVFAILFVLMRKFIVPSFEKTFAERTQAIEGGLSAAETKQAEADAKLAELEKQLADARHEAARIREEAREQGAAIIAEMRVDSAWPDASSARASTTRLARAVSSTGSSPSSRRRTARPPGRGASTDDARSLWRRVRRHRRRPHGRR